MRLAAAVAHRAIDALNGRLARCSTETAVDELP